MSRLSGKEIWTWPAALALLSTVGLVAGLLGTGALDVISWVGLAVPVAVSLWALWPADGR
jgi:hypothetical protein